MKIFALGYPYIIGVPSHSMPEKKKHDEEEYPQPRLKIIDDIYDKVDKIMSDESEKHQLTLMEMEILMLYLQKKLEHQELITLVAHDHDSSNDSFKGTTDLYS